MKKIIVALILIALVLGGYYYLKPSKNTPLYDMTGKVRVNGSGEAIEDAKFTGYFAKVGTPYDKGIICDSFVVTESQPSDVADYFKQLVKSGNQINQLDSSGNLVVSLDLSESRQFADQIMASTKTKPITLSIQKLVEREQGALDCFSPILILDVE